MLSAELDVMPLIDPAKEKSKAKGAGDSRSVPSTPSAQKKEQQQTAEEKEKEREKEKEKEGEAAVAKTVTLLFTAFCRSPIFAESMINEVRRLFLPLSSPFLTSLSMKGLMMLLRHDRLVNAKLLPYTMAGARNPWHVLWTQLVRLIAMLLIPLGSTTHFIEQVRIKLFILSISFQAKDPHPSWSVDYRFASGLSDAHCERPHAATASAARAPSSLHCSRQVRLGAAPLCNSTLPNHR